MGRQCRDLGQSLIWMMLSSKYEWCDVAKLFVEESFSRKVRWMVKNPECKHLNTTAYVADRLRLTLDASKISRRLVMFQVWFMKNTTTQTLKGYNDRVGRPQTKVRNEIFAKSKFILSSDKWSDYFNELDIVLRDDKDLDQLLRYSVYRSNAMGYHHADNRHSNYSYQGLKQYGYGYGNGMMRAQVNQYDLIEFMKPPPIKVKGARKLPTRKRMNGPVHKQSVHKARNGSKKKF